MKILDNYSIESVKQKIDELTATHCEDLKSLCLELAQVTAQVISNNKKEKKDPKYLGIPNISFSLVGPDDDRDEEYSKQRMERGFDSSELWSLKDTITNFILPRLKVFVDAPCGYPGCFDCEDDWKKILGKMVRSFEISKRDGEGFVLTDKEGEEFDEGMELFKEYFFLLWH